MRRGRLCMAGITLRTGWSARISTRALTMVERVISSGGTLLIRSRFSAGPTCLRMCARRARGTMKSGARRGLRGLRGAAMVAAALLPAPLPRRLRRRVRPLGTGRRVASHRASGVGRAAGIPALATGTPALRGSRSRHRAGARSAGCPRQLGQARATMMTTLAGPRAFRPRTRPLLGSSQAWGRRLPTAIGFALRRKTIDPKKCLARTWGDGAGAQCRSLPAQGCDVFCKRHFGQQGTKGWHGRVDGAIPEAKLKEFQGVARRASRAASAPAAPVAGALPEASPAAVASAGAARAGAGSAGGSGREGAARPGAAPAVGVDRVGVAAAADGARGVAAASAPSAPSGDGERAGRGGRARAGAMAAAAAEERARQEDPDERRQRLAIAEHNRQQDLLGTVQGAYRALGVDLPVGMNKWSEQRLQEAYGRLLHRRRGGGRGVGRARGDGDAAAATAGATAAATQPTLGGASSGSSAGGSAGADKVIVAESSEAL